MPTTPPAAVPPHLANIVLTTYSSGWERERAPGSNRCAALPARGFRHAYPAGCQRRTGHGGDHSPVASVAARMDDADARRHRTGQRSTT